MRSMIEFYRKYKILNSFIIMQLIIFLLIFISLGIADGQALTWIYLCILVLSLLSCYSIYRIYLHVSAHIALEAEAALYHKQQQIQKEHLMVSNENRENLMAMREKIHEELQQENYSVKDVEEARIKASNLIDKYADLYTIDYCQNKIVDAILYNKLLLAKSHSIKTSVQVMLPEQLAIKDTDLMFLFTNLLDNAIEACQKLPKKERYLEVEAMLKANYLSVRVRNAKDEAIQLESKSMRSTKEDSENHGLGLQIIKRVCKKNHGTFQIDDQGKQVDMFATLALSDEQEKECN